MLIKNKKKELKYLKKKAYQFSYIMYLKFFRETENNVPEMFAPHLTLLSGFIGGGDMMSVKNVQPLNN